MKRFFIILYILFGGILQSTAQNYYWVAFTDKNNSAFAIDEPEYFLSERAIQRRINQNIPIDSLDLPVNQLYIDSVLSLGVNFVHASKWLNGITVSSEHKGVVDYANNWSFVKEVQLTKPASSAKSVSDKFRSEIGFETEPIDSGLYGNSVHQVGMMEGQFLHNLNYKGEGIQIAVLDAGFYKVDELTAFDSLWANNQILGARDFVDPGSDIYYTDTHGMMVLSCMGGNKPGELIGTAPKASYWLLRSEDAASEYLIEEDNWVVAAEFADSVGVDIINSSLGYYTFDNSEMDHSYEDMDGHTTRVTRGANAAASRGILVFSSAGNERDNEWLRIIAPSDGDLVIGVGAVDKNLTPAYFSSAGPASDGDIKPNISAMGYHTTLQLSNGAIGMASGTSFSAPVLAGMAASLWQKYPQKTAVQIKESLEQSGHQVYTPDSLLGYGVPNMRSASAILDPLAIELQTENSDWKLYPNPFSDYLILQPKTDVTEVQVLLYTIGGKLLKRWQKSYSPTITLRDWGKVGSGLYLLQLKTDNDVETFKINKISR